MKNKEISILEFQEALIGNGALKPTEMVDLLMAKDKKDLVKKLKKYARKYNK